jgi:predicted O-methyltransferase YrrM
MQFTTQLLSILKIIRLKHIFKAIHYPTYSLKMLKYHYRRVPDSLFIEFFANKWQCSTKSIDDAYESYYSNSFVWDELNKKLAIYPNGYGLQMTRELPVLYLLIRLTRPEIVVETGVAAGASSAYILQALHENGSGKLYSIDLSPDDLPEGKKSGWLVPESFRNRWSLHIGDARDLLEPLLKDLHRIDCFIHDSLHTYDHMIWEFRTSWNYLRQDGLFLSHDVGANDAFLDFMEEKNISWKDYRVFHVLGGFQKT